MTNAVRCDVCIRVMHGPLQYFSARVWLRLPAALGGSECRAERLYYHFGRRNTRCSPFGCGRARRARARARAQISTSDAAAVAAVARDRDHRGRETTPCATALHMLNSALDTSRTRKIKKVRTFCFTLGLPRVSTGDPFLTGLRLPGSGEPGPRARARSPRSPRRHRNAPFANLLSYKKGWSYRTRFLVTATGRWGA